MKNILFCIVFILALGFNSKSQDKLKYSSKSFYNSSRSFKLIDFDVDGKEDLIVSGRSGGVDILQNVSSHSFTLVLNLKDLEECLAVADLNKDGIIDIIGIRKDTLGYYSLNQNFDVSDFMPISHEIKDFMKIKLFDIDSDEDLDLLITSAKRFDSYSNPNWYDKPNYWIIENQGDLKFSAPIKMFSNETRIAEYSISEHSNSNHDKIMLLEFLQDSSSLVLVEYNYTRGELSKGKTIVDEIPKDSYNVMMRNIDKDDSLEILYCHSQFLSILDYNDSIAEYQLINIPHPFARQIEDDVWYGIDKIKIEDQNNDGFSDLFIVGSYDRIGLMWNDGTGRFPSYHRFINHPFDNVIDFDFMQIEGDQFLGTMISTDEEIMSRCLSIQCLNSPWKYITKKK